jgi:hypothetical protein
MECVYCEVGTKMLCIIQINVMLAGLLLHLTIGDSYFLSARLTYAVQNLVLSCHSNRRVEGQ